MKKSRTAIASLFGAMFGTAMTFVPYNIVALEAVFTVSLGFIVSCGMAAIAFGNYRSFPRLLRDSVTVWGAGALLGGIMTFVMSLGTPVYIQAESNFAPPFAVCALISAIAVRLFRSGKSRKTAQVRIIEGKAELCIQALCDSGSFLAEPLSGIPVIIVRERELGELGARLCADEPAGLKLRLIPVSSIGGERMLRGFIPDCVTVDGEEVRAVIAADGGNTDYGGLDGLIPAALCK